MRRQELHGLLVGVGHGCLRVVAGLDEQVEVDHELRHAIAAQQRADALDDAEQLVQVLHALGGFGRFVLRQLPEQAALGDERVEHLARPAPRRLVRERVPQREEAAERLDRGPGHALGRRGARRARDPQQSALRAVRRRVQVQQVERLDPEQRIAEHSVRRGAVVRVGERAQQVQAQHDFRACVEPARAAALERHAARAQAQRERLEVRVRAREDRDVGRPAAPRGDRVGDLVRHRVDFVGAGGERVVDHLGGNLPRGDQALVEARRVLRLEPLGIVELDRPVGDVEDALAGAVIGLQQHDLRRGERVEEAEQVLDLRSTETVDALVVVPDDRQVARAALVRAAAREQFHQLELDVVRVLELVHEDPAVTRLDLAPHVRALAQQPQGQRDLRAEVHAPVLEQQPLVDAVRAGLLELGGGAVAAGRVAGRRREAFGERQVGLGRDVLVACAVEHVDQRREVRVGRAEGQVARQSQLEEPLAQEHQDLGGLLDAQLRRDAQLDRVFAHEPVAERVERRHRRAREPVGHALVHARLHLGGGLVGEREPEDLLGPGALRGDEPGDAAGEDLRLARAGAGDDQERAGAMRDGRALAVVEPVQECVGGGGRRARRGAGRAHRAFGGRRSNGAVVSRRAPSASTATMSSSRMPNRPPK